MVVARVVEAELGEFSASHLLSHCENECGLGVMGQLLAVRAMDGHCLLDGAAAAVVSSPALLLLFRWRFKVRRTEVVQ